MLVDAACEYSMYASDITRTVPVNGHFTPRQREIYNIVLGAQQAAINAFVAGKSKINDRDRRDPDSLDNAAYNYINTHGKDLHGQPLGQYWLHGLGHMVGINVHDPATIRRCLKPGMVFTIEPGVYIPEEKLGVRIECDLSGGRGRQADRPGGRLCRTPRRMWKRRCMASEDEHGPARRSGTEISWRCWRSVFREQLLACLEECARGRKGLFSGIAIGECGRTADGRRRRGCASWRWLCRESLRSRKSGMRCATSFWICARFTARAIPESESWRGRFWSGSRKAKWERNPGGGKTMVILHAFLALLAGFATMPCW